MRLSFYTPVFSVCLGVGAGCAICGGSSRAKGEKGGDVEWKQKSWKGGMDENRASCLKENRQADKQLSYGGGVWTVAIFGWVNSTQRRRCWKKCCTFSPATHLCFYTAQIIVTEILCMNVNNIKLVNFSSLPLEISKLSSNSKTTWNRNCNAFNLHNVV